YWTQMTWHFNPNSICSSFSDDCARLVDHPLLLSRVSREPVSKKGKLQAIDLSDVSTLEPVFRQERGSLVPRYDTNQDLRTVIPRELDEALHMPRVTTEGSQKLHNAWHHCAD